MHSNEALRLLRACYAAAEAGGLCNKEEAILRFFKKTEGCKK
jgi:hypothetical protein